MVISSCFPSLRFKLVVDFDFCIRKNLWDLWNSETETIEKRRTSQEHWVCNIETELRVLS